MNEKSIKNIVFNQDSLAKGGELELFITSRNFEDVLVSLKHSILNEEMWIIHEINTQMLLEKGGYLISPVRQLLFFHPRYMVEILSINAYAAIEAPLKILVMELPDKKVQISYQSPSYRLMKYGGLERLAIEFEKIYDRLIESIA